MFNSPINRLFGVSSIGQGGKQEQGKKDEKEENKKDEKYIFEEDAKLYTDISTEDYDVESFVRRFFDDLKKKEQSERALKKIDEFLQRFDLIGFERKYGENLSKEDLSVVLYSIAEKFGAKI